jgi:hypothetical protein
LQLFTAIILIFRVVTPSRLAGRPNISEKHSWGYTSSLQGIVLIADSQKGVRKCSLVQDNETSSRIIAIFRTKISSQEGNGLV